LLWLVIDSVSLARLLQQAAAMPWHHAKRRARARVGQSLLALVHGRRTHKGPTYPSESHVFSVAFRKFEIHYSMQQTPKAAVSFALSRNQPFGVRFVNNFKTEKDDRRAPLT
jgi:hypothetical protein